MKVNIYELHSKKLVECVQLELMLIPTTFALLPNL